MHSQVKVATASKGKQRIIVPEYLGPSTQNQESKKFGSDIGASNFSSEFSKQLVKPVTDWKFSFGRYKNIQLQDADPTQLRPWCRWLVKKLMSEKPISAAYAQAYLDNKSYPTVCDWSKNEHPFITIGRYRGFPVNIVNQEHPGYFKWLLSSELSSHISDSMKEYVDQHFISK
jgi:hypothetical protein